MESGPIGQRYDKNTKYNGAYITWKTVLRRKFSTILSIYRNFQEKNPGC